MSSHAFPEPSSTPDLRGLLLSYLDYYRSVISCKIGGLERDELQRITVPSGWTPAGLVNHLANVERRWIRWGFMAETMADPWADREGTGWVSPDLTAEELTALLEEAGRRTRSVVEAHDLAETARVGGRFPDTAAAPQLHWILLHLIQEYARHAGHLDLARELIDGQTGEEP
ncbi:DinB family protein [Humibacillus xanthopallidus]|nr:DinB family protein [Humibacillus xanthopallidus]